MNEAAPLSAGQLEQHATDCMQAIFDAYCSGPETLAGLQRSMQSHTSAGIGVLFELDDGSCIGCADKRGNNGTLVERVRRIGFCLGPQAPAVSARWMDLARQPCAESALIEFTRLVSDTATSAQRLAGDVLRGDDATA